MDFPYSSQSDIDKINKAILSSLDDEDPLLDHSIANTLSYHDGSQENCSPLFGVDWDDVYNNHIEFNQVQHDHHQQEEPQPPCFAPMIAMMMTKQTVSDQQYIASSSATTTFDPCSELMDLLYNDELFTSTSSSAATVVANSPQIRRKPIKANQNKKKGQKKSQNDVATASDELSTTTTSSSYESTSRKRSSKKRAQNQIETESCKEAVASEKKKERESDAHHEQLNLNQEDFIKTITVHNGSILEVKYDVGSAHRPFRTADKLSITLNSKKVEFTVEERQHFSKRAGLSGRLYDQPFKSKDGVLELGYALFVDNPNTRRAGTYRVLIDVSGIKIIVRFIVGQKGGGGDLRLKSMQVEQQVFERII